MEPAFLEGDHVVTFNWTEPHTGDAVVFRSNGKNLIKRIATIKSGKIYVKGDNRKFSLKIGPVKSDQIVGKVIAKY